MKKTILIILSIYTYILNGQVDTIPIGGSLWGGGSRIQDLLIDNNNNYWIAYSNPTASQSGVKRFDGTTWSFYQTSNSPLPSNRVNAIYQDANNNYWFGTHAGLAKFDGVNWTVYNKLNSGICSDTIYAIKELGGSMFLGTNTGLCKYNGLAWATYNTQNSGLMSEKITCLDSDGQNIYLGTSGGLSVLTTTGIINYPHDFGAGDIISSVKSTVNNGIVVATMKGAYVFSNGIYQSLEESFELCTAPYFFSIGYWTRKIYIETNMHGGISLNYGDYIMEYNGTLAGKLNINSGVGFIKRINNFYHVLRFNGTQWTILRTPEITDINLFQQVDLLDLGCGFRRLNINNVNAKVLAQGDMFWDAYSSAGYEVPKGAGIHATLAGGLWIGGKVNNQLRTACQTYRQQGVDYWMGPLDTTDALNPAGQQKGKIIKVNRFDIENFIYNFNNGNVQNGTFTPTFGIMYWPAHDTGCFSRNTAPFVDVNNNGIYDPLIGGDYPKIKGDQMIYNIFNDASGQHFETGSINPLGLEIRQSSYAYTCPGIADSMRALNYTTFYEFEIINRSANIIDSMYIGFWNDTDFGNYIDDYIGCNVNENYGYVYNGDNNDEDNFGTLGYHNYLPCFSTAILQSPKAIIGDGKDNNHNGIVDEQGEEVGMSSFIGYDNTLNSTTGNPQQNPIQYYNYLQGKWKDGSTMKYGGNGVVGTTSTTFLYPGASDPIGYGVGGSPTSPNPQPAWTEATALNPPGDRRFLIGSGPIQLAAKDTTKIVYAMIFTQDSVVTGDNVYNVVKNEQDVKRIRNWYLNNNFPSCLDLSTVNVKEIKKKELALKVYPNPTTNQLTIETEGLTSATHLEITDVLGKLLLQKQLYNNVETINLTNFQSGIYFVKVKNQTGQKTVKIIKE